MRPWLPLVLAVLLLPLATLARPVPTAPAAVLSQTAEDAHGGHSSQIGEVHFPTSCSAAVQQEFDRAVAMLHSFTFEPAREAFTRVTQLDSSCGMGHWGIAMTWLGNPFAQPPESWVPLGAAAAEQAVAAGAQTPRERDYIAAIAAFYRDWVTTPYIQRALAYEQAMEHVYATYPDDTEAAIFYALALNITASPTDKSFANVLQAAAILERLFADQPLHPGIAHYLIHSYDYPPLAQRGLVAARRYASIAPAAPHAQHMPSHIFTRVGDWQESVDSNRAALAADRQAPGARPDVALAEGLHAQDYMMYGYLQIAQDRQAKALLDDLYAIRRVDQPVIQAGYALAAIPARYALERGQWAEAAALVLPSAEFDWSRFPQGEAIAVFARALGAARSGDVPGARAAINELTILQDTLVASENRYWAEQVAIQRDVATAWTARAEGRSEALALMQAAADREEATDKHPVTPGPIAPARELLGELLLELGQPAQALAAFEHSQRAEPERFRGLFGAARAAEVAGERDKARTYYEQLLAVAASADTERPELQQARAFLDQQ